MLDNELSLNITEAMLHYFIARNKYYFDVHTFIDQQINKRSLEDWKLCRHNHGHHDKADSSISETVIRKKKVEIAVHDCIKARWINFYPQDGTGDDSDFQLLYSILCICMIDRCDEQLNFVPTVVSLSPAEEKRLEGQVVKKASYDSLTDLFNICIKNKKE